MSRKTPTAPSARVFSPVVLILLPLLLGASSTGEPESVIEIGLTRAFETELDRSAAGIPVRRLGDGIRVRVASDEPTDLYVFVARIERGRVVAEHSSDEFECFPKEWKMIPLDSEHLSPKTDVLLTSDRVLSGSMVAANRALPDGSSIAKLLGPFNGRSGVIPDFGPVTDGIYLVALPTDPAARSSANVRPMLILFDSPR